jgi:hypothetical protein
MASLHIHVKAETEGSVIVSAGGRELARHNFERGGFFHRNKPEDFTYDLTQEVSAAIGEIRVILAPAGQKGDVKMIPAGLRGGSSHRLDITLAKEGKSSVQLN